MMMNGTGYRVRGAGERGQAAGCQMLGNGAYELAVPAPGSRQPVPESLDVRGRKLAVARGYEQIAAQYAAVRREDAAIQRWVDALVANLPADARLLDLGCGAATPYTRRLATRFGVVGLDIARAPLRLARGNVGAGRFVQGDICALPFGAGTFDAALSLYAIIHVPRSEHLRILNEAHRVLRPGAPLLVVMGAGSLEEDWEDYHGVRMHWSHYGAAVSRRLVEQAGFEITRDGIVADQDGGAHAFILGRKR